MYMLQVKFVLCLEIDYFFVSYFILAIINDHFWCQIHFVLVVFALLVCSFNLSGILGLISASTAIVPQHTKKTMS